MTLRDARAIAIAFAAYTAAAVAYTWPLAIKLGGVPHDPGDPLLTTWFLWWDTQAVPLTARWWNAPMFFPAPGAFAFSEHLLGLTPIAVPFTLLTGQPLVGHNVAFIATYVLGALGAHFLAYTLTKRHDVSAIAALAFAFAPYRLPQAPHIQVLASFWTPVCLGALHRYAQTWRVRWIVLAAAAWVLQALCCGYFAVFLTVLVALWFLWFAAGRWPVRRLAVAGGAFAAGALALLPFLRGYKFFLRDTYGFSRGIGEIRGFSADAASLLSAGEDLLVWSWVRVIERPEANLFPGLTIVLLCGLALRAARPFTPDALEPRWTAMVRRALLVVLLAALAASALPLLYGAWHLTLGGLRIVSIARADKPFTVAFYAALVLIALLPGVRAVFRRRSTAAFYLIAAFATWLFTLGPDPTFMDHRLLYRAPYGLLMQLPGFEGLRVPARFWTMTLVCLAVTGALAVHRLEGFARRTVIGLALAGLLLDGWPKRFVVRDAPPIRPSPREATLRLDLPVADSSDPQALYQQIFDPKPLLNGFSGFAPPHYAAMRELLKEHDPGILRALAALGSIGVVIDHAADTDGALRAMVRAYPGSTPVHADADWSSYLIPQATAIDDGEEPRGSALRIAAVSASEGAAAASKAIDGDVATSWGAEKHKMPVTFTAELGGATDVGQIVVALGPFASAFPMNLRIDVSPDGSRWDTVWSGPTALLTYHAGVRHPTEVPVVYPIRRGDVRFIRLTQTGERDWSIAELRVLR
jgi:hypothetical protein